MYVHKEWRLGVSFLIRKFCSTRNQYFGVWAFLKPGPRVNKFEVVWNFLSATHTHLSWSDLSLHLHALTPPTNNMFVFSAIHPKVCLSSSIWTRHLLLPVFVYSGFMHMRHVFSLTISMVTAPLTGLAFFTTVFSLVLCGRKTFLKRNLLPSPCRQCI